jgi:hypothetical protein
MITYSNLIIFESAPSRAGIRFLKEEEETAVKAGRGHGTGHRRELEAAIDC